MTETSLPWGGTTVGDAALAPYTDDAWSDWQSLVFTTDRTTQGILFGYLSEMKVTGIASPVMVSNGAAIVDGKIYVNDSAINLAIPTPGGATRIDLIVLRKDFVAQTVRVVRVAGVEGGGAPSPVQIDGTTWDIPFYQASITTGGVITLTDRRIYAYTRLLPGNRLTSNRTYYVRTDGNDDNNGLTNTSGGAFLTIQRAINVVCSLDLQQYNVTIQVGAGTYAPFSLYAYQSSAPISGRVTILGDATTPANVVISGTNVTAAILGTHGCGIWYLSGLKLTTSVAGHGIAAPWGCEIAILGKMDFGVVAAGYDHIFTTVGGRVEIDASYNITGGGRSHYNASGGGFIGTVGALTITLSGTPAFTTAFAYANSVSYLEAIGNTYSGAATGSRYQAILNAVIQTSGGGANYFPGNAVGTTATGGQYA
jgi:hypothetical protein